MPFPQIRLKDFTASEPWRRVRSAHGMAHYSGEYASATKVAQALAWPGQLVERHGWEYEIWSGADRTLLENVRFLAGYRHPGVVPEEEVERAWHEVLDGEEMALAERLLSLLDNR